MAVHYAAYLFALQENGNSARVQLHLSRGMNDWSETSVLCQCRGKLAYQTLVTDLFSCRLEVRRNGGVGLGIPTEPRNVINTQPCWQLNWPQVYFASSIRGTK